MKLKRVIALATASLLFVACDAIPTDPLTPAAPDAEISDAAHNGSVEGFYFLSPIVPDPITTGTFDPSAEPRVVICELDTTATPHTCGTLAEDTVAEYTLTSGPDGATISVSTIDEHYRVNWNTKNFQLNTEATYRITVVLGAIRLGFADVELGANQGELRNVNTNEYISLVDNQTLPIKFRIEEGAGCEGGLDCGSGTVGPEGGIVTSANGVAGVSVPVGAVDNPITITIQQVDPSTQPGGLCLPTGIRQDGACYEFDTVEEISSVQNDGSDTFHELVTVAICPSPNAERLERLTLHKYNPERAAEGVVELENTSEAFLECDYLTGPGYAVADDASFFGRLAGVAKRVLSPVASVLFPGDLHATDTGRAGLTDSFSRITWAESITLVASGAPASALVGDVVQITAVASTAHNHGQVGPVSGSGAQLRFDYTDPSGTTGHAYVTTDANGEASFPWTLNDAGVHTLEISSRDIDPSLTGAPLIEDPTPVQTVQLVVCGAGQDCGAGTVDETGGIVTTASGEAGVSVPAGAVTSPVTIVIHEVDPANLPGGLCLPTGIRQDGACYDFDTVEEISEVTGGSTEFLELVTVAICPSQNAIREERLTLHKYNPERSGDGVIELAGTQEAFLTCPDDQVIGTAPSGFFGRVAHVAGRALSPVVALVAPRTLYATDTGRAGLTDSFSRITWAESLTLSASGVPTTAAPGDVLTGTISGLTGHNHDPSTGASIDPTAATDAGLRFDYTDASGATSVWHATTDAQGEVALSWPLTQETGSHTLVISSRGTDSSLTGNPLIEDPTAHLVISVNVEAEPTCTVCTVEVVPDPLTITVDREYALDATALDGYGNETTGSFTWQSSNVSVATVDATGLVTGLASGTATIIATESSGAQGTAALTVLPAGSVGGITGVVRDAATGAAVPGAEVVIQGTTLGTLTDTNGAYTLSQVPAGTQTLTVSISGYFGASVLVTVPNGGTATVDVDLTSSTPIDG